MTGGRLYNYGYIADHSRKFMAPRVFCGSFDSGTVFARSYPTLENDTNGPFSLSIVSIVFRPYCCD